MLNNYLFKLLKNIKQGSPCRYQHRTKLESIILDLSSFSFCLSGCLGLPGPIPQRLLPVLQTKGFILFSNHSSIIFYLIYFFHPLPTPRPKPGSSHFQKVKSYVKIKFSPKKNLLLFEGHQVKNQSRLRQRAFPFLFLFFFLFHLCINPQHI